MGCHKQSELNSLRAQVKRLEDGREVRNLNDELQKKNRRIESLLKDNERLKGEIYRLQQDNSSLQEDLSTEQLRRNDYHSHKGLKNRSGMTGPLRHEGNADFSSATFTKLL